MPTLRQFNLNLEEFYVLDMCERSERVGMRIKTALDPQWLTRDRRTIVRNLQTRALTRYSMDTGKWELTEAGLAFLTSIRYAMQEVLPPNPKLGEVVEISIGRKG